MSRTRRKTPIFGHTTSRSERKDKQHWHQRWRVRERTVLAGASLVDLSSHMTLHEKQVSDVWSMAKDGHSYWPIKCQIAFAHLLVNGKGRNPTESASLKKRMLRKWMSK
jgi:hypothetical protein